MYASILLPTDGNQEMAPVINQAVELASLCDATVHILHVVDERAYHAVPDEARDQVRETLSEDADSFTKSAANRAIEAGLEVVREVRWGDPAPAILSYAAENDLELIVMGTHGRTGYERYLLGSVAEKVVRMAPMPVLAIAVGDIDAQREAILTATASETTAVDRANREEADALEGPNAEETQYP